MTPRGRVLDTLQRAVALHRAGKTDDAAAAYHAVLKVDPRNADALNLLGVISQERAEHEAALAYYGRAVQSAPRMAGAYFNRGNLLSALGRGREARADYARAIDIQPDFADAYLNLGVQAHRDGDLQVAVQILRKMTARWPQDARGHYNLARCLIASGDTATAEPILDAALKLAPSSRDILVTLARLYETTDRAVEAAVILRRAIALGGDVGELNSTLGNCLVAAGDWEAAFAAHRAACAADPARPAYLFNFANAYYAAGRFSESEALLRRLVVMAPTYTDAYVNLGQVLADQGRDDEAMAVFDQALAIAPDKAEAADNKAAVLTNKALTLLAAGRYDEGWQIYRRRFDHRTISTSRRPFDTPAWCGEDLSGRSLLLWTDQGLGDEIMYASMVPDAARLAAHCMLECSPRLQSLFARSFAGVSVVARQNPPAAAIADFMPDVQSSVPDLGGYLRATAQAFPAHHGYLRADSTLRMRLVERYRALARGRPVVGISWRSDSGAYGRFKSLPLSRWDGILRDDVLFVSLQYGDSATELADANAECGIEVLHDAEIDAMSELDPFAAQVAAMDLVISVSNTTVHFAGALGVQIWTMVPSGKGALWYVRNGTSSVWYPGMRIFRQAQPGDWAGVVANVSEALNEWRAKWTGS